LGTAQSRVVCTTGPNEVLKTMLDEEFLIRQAWVNEILTLPEKTIDTACQSQSTMNSTIFLLHKGGSTNKTSDQRPVVLLNSGYQLLNYIINLRRAAEKDRGKNKCVRTGAGKVEVSTSTCKK